MPAWIAPAAQGNNGTLALGYGSQTYGNYGSVSMGYFTVADGNYGSVALGHATRSTGNGCTAVEAWNDTIVVAGSPLVHGSPVFIVGNGASGVGNLSNVMVVLKNGSIGLSTNTPDGHLHLRSDDYGDTTGIKLTNSGTNSRIYQHPGGHLIMRK